MTRAPMLEPAKTIAPVETIVPSPIVVGGSGSRFGAGGSALSGTGAGSHIGYMRRKGYEPESGPATLGTARPSAPMVLVGSERAECPLRRTWSCTSSQ